MDLLGGGGTLQIDTKKSFKKHFVSPRPKGSAGLSRTRRIA
jgi:hypothetical protein